MLNAVNNMSNIEYAARYGVASLNKRDEKNKKLSAAELFAEPAEDKEDILARLKQSMKDFRDETLTGIDDEDRRKMNDELQAYLKDKGIADKELDDMSAAEVQGLDNFIKGLLEKYGKKSKAEDFGGFFMQKNNNALRYKYEREEIV